MSCDCQPTPTNEKVLACTGSCSEERFYKMMQSCPPKEPGPCGMPVVNDDGSIEYPQGEPPDILGYARVGRLFRPAWASCRWRTLHVTHPNGCIAVRGYCGFPRSDHYLKPVRPDQCESCPVRRPMWPSPTVPRPLVNPIPPSPGPSSVSSVSMSSATVGRGGRACRTAVAWPG